MIDYIAQLVEEDARTLYQIAKDAGVDYALLYRLTHGKVKRDIYLSTAFKLADALGVSVEEFRESRESD